MNQVKVYIGTEKMGGRKLVNATLLENRPTTLKVQLPDGNIITRKKARDLPKGD